MYSRSRSRKRSRKVYRKVRKFNRILAPTGHRGATELKFVDVPSAYVAASVNGAWILLNGCTEGAGPYQRIGRRIRMKSVHLRFHIVPTANGSGQIVNQKLRLMLIYDKQTNGAAPAIGDLLLAFKYDGTNTSTTWDGLNMNNRDRFVVLRDTPLTLPNTGAAGAAPAPAIYNNASTGFVWGGLDVKHGSGQMSCDWFVKLGGLETYYKNSTGLVGDVATGGLFFFIYSADDAGANSNWQVGYTARLKFYD